VEPPLTGRDSGELGESRGQRHRISAHEPVVIVSTDVEAQLPLPPAPPLTRWIAMTSRPSWAAATDRLTRLSRTPTSRSRFANADPPGRVRESPPVAGRAATGTRLALRRRPLL